MSLPYTNERGRRRLGYLLAGMWAAGMLGGMPPRRGTFIGMFIPVGDLMRQLVLAIGAAMVIGSIAVVVRERRRDAGDLRPGPSWPIVAMNLVLGLVLTLWGVSSILVAR